MYRAIKDFCDSEQYGNGLFLIDMPTGFGKTHTVLDYIYNSAISDENNNRKIFFITTLKKNLPVEELRGRFYRLGQLDQFNDKFLFIDSNADCAVNNLSNELIRIIPEYIKKTDEYRSFERDVKFIQQKGIESTGDVKNIAIRIKEEFRTQTEPKFRQYVSRLIMKQFSTVRERLYAIHTNNEWKWLGCLYPAVFTKDRQIIFMSIDKFLTRNATIVEPSYMFYNSEIIENAIIFIDEFDATKDTFLKSIIQNGLRDRIDFLDLFKDIYSALQTKEFPEILTTSSKRRQKSDYKGKPLSSIIDGFKEKAEIIYQNYSLQFSHKTNDEGNGADSNFLFQDHQFHSILDGMKNYVSTSHDLQAKLNRINFVEKKPELDSNNIFVMLGKLRGFVSFFQRGINILAYNYMECKQEHKNSGENEFTREAAIRSVLAEFRLSRRYIDYLTSSIMMSSHRSRGTLSIPDFDLSFYEKGFRYYSFENDDTHDMQSQIMMCAFQVTPEKILLRFCEKAKVIGISATATIPTVIGNYDIEYLRSKLQSSFHYMNTIEKRNLEAQFQAATEGYRNISIKTAFISGAVQGVYSIESWQKVFSDNELSEAVYDKIEQKLSMDNNNYNKQRYVRIALAYKEFIIHPDIQSFLCLLTKHPKPGDRCLDLMELEEIFRYIAQENAQYLPPNFHVNSSIEQLDGEEYDNKKEHIIKRLAKGNKVFVISVYQTMGAGQNVQYPVPNDKENILIKTNKNPIRHEKDFDAIYVDKPTNLLVNLDNSLSEEDFVKYLFQTEFLQQNGELCSLDALQHIKKAFKCFSTQNNNNLNFAMNAYRTKSVELLSTRTIIQAVGRICRTNLKNSNIYIFADERLVDDINPSISNDRLLNPEFMALLNAVITKKAVVPEEGSLEATASLLSVRVNTFINNLVRENWTEDRMDKWKILRSMVLKSPTLSAKSIEHNFIAKNFYIRLPQPGSVLYYSQFDDYTDINISFLPSKEYPQEVSEISSRLNLLMRIPGVKAYFEENGWATTFTRNDFLMSPALFNNIYKGVLGEVIGKFLLHRLLNIDLEEIHDPNDFELFDFKVKNLPIYVDFKHWQESTYFSKDKMLGKIQEKLKRCRGKCALIINIISDSNYETHRVGTDYSIVEIPSVYNSHSGQLNMQAIDEIRRCIYEFSD